jgi:hypothetical protein
MIRARVSHYHPSASASASGICSHIQGGASGPAMNSEKKSKGLNPRPLRQTTFSAGGRRVSHSLSPLQLGIHRLNCRSEKAVREPSLIDTYRCP